MGGKPASALFLPLNCSSIDGYWLGAEPGRVVPGFYMLGCPAPAEAEVPSKSISQPPITL